MDHGFETLRNKLSIKRSRVNLRYHYYDMKNRVQEVQGVIPREFKWLAYSLGWCAKAVDSLSDRIVFDTFEHDDYLLNEIFALNNRDVLFDSAVLSALIASCSFIYISPGDSGYPRLQVIDGGNATGVIDPTTNLLTEGYAVMERDKYGNPALEAYFTPYKTQYYVNGTIDDSMTFYHPAPYALLVPVVNRPDARRPFGHSHISRSCMDIVQAVTRTLRRTEVAAEFYSFPQKYVLGMSNDAEFNNRRATMSSFLNLTKDEDGEHPTVGQFQQQSMSPFVEQVRMLASVFAGETGLTLDDLGFTTENPSSAEAIKASHEALRLTASKAQRTFGTGFLNAGYLAACLRDKQTYDRKAFAAVQPAWMPIFEPDAAGLGAIGDAILKINQAVPDFLGSRNIKKLTGLESDAE